MTTSLPRLLILCWLVVALLYVRFADAQLAKQPPTKQEQSSKPATTTEAYSSAAEGRKQRFQVVLPPGYSPKVKYPMVVQVFGSASLLPTRENPFIRVRPNGRGVWGYRAMSRYDVMQAIERMKTVYRIDENRVYMTGSSAGAAGMMHVAAQRPDVFAGLVPLVAFGNDLPLENLRNVPRSRGLSDYGVGSQRLFPLRL